jgi:hypothetical protein
VSSQAPARSSPTSTRRRAPIRHRNCGYPSLDLSHGLDRRLHRRRLGRRRLDQLGRACAISATSSPARRHLEAEPRVLELTGEDLHKVTHAYGTNGIITEVEMPLTAAYDWVDVIVGFDTFIDAAATAMRWPAGRPADQGDLADRRALPHSTISSATSSSSSKARASVS